MCMLWVPGVCYFGCGKFEFEVSVWWLDCVMFS